MALELKMPALSPTMEKGTLARWLVKVGDIVKPGDLLAEIETDKATMEFESVDEGRISALLIREGSENVKVGTVIAVLGDEAAVVEATTVLTPMLVKAVPVAAAASKPVAASSPASGMTFPAPASGSLHTTVSATPLARRIAAVKGIALTSVIGTGVNGKIVKADLGLDPIRLAAPMVVAAAVSPVPEAADFSPPAGVPVESVKLSGMRKTIARRLTQSKQTVPHFYLTARCQLDALLRLRGEVNAGLATRGIKLSVNDFLIKAMAKAMTDVPDVNVQFGGEVLHRFRRIDISMAVAIDGGLVTPIIRDVGSLSLSAIAQQSKVLAEKARNGKLVPEDYQGGTASISNLGMFGIDEMFPVINPPQALILGIGAGVEQPWKVGGQIALATIMAVTASFDHRAIDGAAAARFMAALREIVEMPLALVT